MASDKEQIKAQLKELKKFAGIGREQVAEELHYTPAYINQMLGKDGKLPPRFILTFNELYKRNMDTPPPTTPPMTIQKGDKKLMVKPNDNTLYIQRKEDSGFTDYARRMAAATHFHEVEGDAMHPMIQRGTGLLLIEIDKNLIVGGEAYVIELQSGLTVVRYIKFDEKAQEKILLESFNKSAGNTFDVQRLDIKRLFKIVLKIAK
jgi:hypothetical protein